MHSKSEQIFIGIIVLLTGVIFIFQNAIELGVSSLALFVTGFSLLLLYRTKKKIWALVFGFVVLYTGASAILADNSSYLANAGLDCSSMTFAAALVAIGFLLLILFNDFNKNGLLIPGAIIASVGLNTFTKTLAPSISDVSFPLYMGICFSIIYIRGRYFLGRWPLIISYAFFAAFLLKIFLP